MTESKSVMRRMERMRAMNESNKIATSGCATATPVSEVERQICDCNVPKNEREWWAAGEITRLREENQQLRARLDKGVEVQITAYRTGSGIHDLRFAMWPDDIFKSGISRRALIILREEGEVI